MQLAARWIADMKVCAQQSYRVATRRQSFSFANMFSMRWRFLYRCQLQSGFDFRFFLGEIQAVIFRSARDCLGSGPVNSLN
jgi:hypothetical protein